MAEGSENGFRTHEPALRELTAELDGFKALMDERDRRYCERDNANKEAVKQALGSAEKAGDKTESALKEYKVSANEWRDTVKDIVGQMVTKTDISRELKLFDEKIATLREAMDRGTGKSAGLNTAWTVLTGTVILIAMLIGIGTFIFKSAPIAQPQIILMPATTTAAPATVTTTSVPSPR